MNWELWNEKQKEKEKRARRKKPFTTNSYGNVGNSFKQQSKRRKQLKLNQRKRYLKSLNKKR